MEREGGGGGFGEHLEAVRRDAMALLEELRAAARDLARRLDLQGRVQRNPYGTLLAAAGVGYILGGGLFTRATGRILGAATRLLLVPLVRAELAVLAASLLGAGEEEPREIKYHS